MEIKYLDYKDNCYDVLKPNKKYIFLTGNKRSLTMTGVKHGSFNQYLHVDILLVCSVTDLPQVCLTVNDTLINILSNFLCVECNNLLHNNTCEVHVVNEILF